jgi:hypothetical protein
MVHLLEERGVGAGVPSQSLAESESIEAAIASFIVWLARQHASAEERRQAPSAVERFLRWQRHQRTHGRDHGEHAYYDELRRSGASDAQVALAREAIRWLEHYLRARMA